MNVFLENNPTRLDISIIALLGTRPFIRLAILFGSVAKAQARFNSDLDLALLADTMLSANQRIGLIDDLAVHYYAIINRSIVHALASQHQDDYREFARSVAIKSLS